MVVERDVVELHVLALHAIGWQITAWLEGRNDVTSEASGIFPSDRSRPAEPTGESVVLAIVVVGTIAQLETEVFTGRLVVEVNQCPKVPSTWSALGIGGLVVQGVHGPEIRIHCTTVIVLESASPVCADRTAFEEEVDLQAEVVVVLVHNGTLHEGGSVFELLEGHPTVGSVFDEVMSSAHVAVHVVELQQGIGTVVEVGIVTRRNGVPRLRGSATGADLVPSICAVLHRDHIVQFEVVTGKSCGGSSSSRNQVSLAFNLIISQVTVNGQIGTAQARVGALQGNDPVDGIQVTVAVELVSTVLDDISIPIGTDQSGIAFSFSVGELLAIIVAVYRAFAHELTEARKYVARNEVTEHFL